MNLSGGGGLAAINAYDQAMNDVEKRQRFEWERQRAQAELSNLEAKAKAERSGYELSAGQNQAGLELLPSWKNAQESNYNETFGANQERSQVRPGRVANTIKQQGIDSYGLDRAAIRQPMRDDATDAQVELNLGENRNAISNLPAKTKAQRTTYDLTATKNVAEKDLVPDWQSAQKSTYGETEAANAERGIERPGRIANTLTRQGMENYGLDRASSRQPTEEDAKDTNARSQALTAQGTLDNLPDALQTAAMKGLIDKQGVHEVTQGIVADFIGKNDKQGAIDFMNKLAARGGVNRKVVDIQQTPTGYNFIDADGGSHVMPVADVYRARQMYLQKLNAGKYHFLAAKDGSVVAGNENTGRADVVYQGNPNTMNQEHKPAEVKTAEWLIQNGVAKDANQAWNLVSSAKEKTRSAFVMDYVSKNAMPGQDTSKIAQQAGTLYDTLKDSEAPAPTQNTQKSNNPQGDKLLKKLNLGVP